LQAAETLARTLGYSKIYLLPKPFEGDYPERKLIEWYRKHSYQWRADCPSKWKKNRPVKIERHTTSCPTVLSQLSFIASLFPNPSA
jgi:hypothetical protein